MGVRDRKHTQVNTSLICDILTLGRGTMKVASSKYPLDLTRSSRKT